VAEVRQAVGEPAPFVAPSNYQVAAELAYYGGFRRFGATFARRSQFNIWNDVPAANERVVVVSLQPAGSGTLERMLGGPAAPPARIDAYFAGTPIRTLWISVPRTTRATDGGLEGGKKPG
jgi:hypothetical protein